jgi:hypothetical protein
LIPQIFRFTAKELPGIKIRKKNIPNSSIISNPEAVLLHIQEVLN